MTPNPTTTEDLFAPCGLAVFEQRDDGLFRPVSTLPEWLAVGPGPVDLAELFPFLEIFLPDCEDAWQSGIPARSDIWTEQDPRGGEIYLQAVAARAGERRYIALRSLPEGLFRYQQMAHVCEMQRDDIARIGRELEMKKLEAERATKAKSDFLATMSHEIRTPLNAIIGMADVLSASPLTAEQQRCVEIFQRNGVALLNLINDILDLSKVESGHVELEATELDLHEVLARAIEVVEVRTRAKGLWLRQEIAPGVPRYLIGDPNRLRQIIINLLGNSIKFTEQGGIGVRVERDPAGEGPGDLRFAIVDTGIGIPAEKLGLIFESFTQADSSTTRKYGGTGLGLTISRQLVELMNGRIWVESEVGVGSTFFFTVRFQVPADQSERGGAQALRAARISLSELEAAASGLRILLVDDSDDNRVLILAYLRRVSCAIEVAEDGKQAVERFGERKYDVVLMDVEMPGMDGYEATREIRRIEQKTGASPTPVLALTAHAFAEMASKGAAAGFTESLTKPIRQTTLLEALLRHTGPRESRPSPARITVEQGMEDIVPAYLEKRQADIPIYRASLEAGDFEAIRKMAHKMRGTGGGYGFPRLTEIGEAIEEAAGTADAESIRRNLEEFADYLETVELEYQK
jgi:signal transduction histidine kinase/DNA-binding NarL/FixJ family response regulator